MWTGTGCQARAGFHSLSEPGRGGYRPASWAWTQWAGCNSRTFGYKVTRVTWADMSVLSTSVLLTRTSVSL